MSTLWTKMLPELEQCSTKELRERYQQLFGESTLANNKPWLIRRIAWRMQAQAEGGLSEAALKRAQELAQHATIRLSPPSVRQPKQPAPTPVSTDRRLPPVGTVIVRHYKGQDLRVKVVPQGIEYEGQVFASLTAVAKAITGTHTNGFFFFRLGQYQRSKA